MSLAVQVPVVSARNDVRAPKDGAPGPGRRTPFPSDSFPGMVGQATGGDPRVTGVYYDDTITATSAGPSPAPRWSVAMAATVSAS